MASGQAAGSTTKDGDSQMNELGMYDISTGAVWLMITLFVGFPLVWWLSREWTIQAEQQERMERKSQDKEAEEQERAAQRLREDLKKREHFPDSYFGRRLTIEELKAMSPVDRYIAVVAGMASKEDRLWADNTDAVADEARRTSDPQRGGDFSI